MEDRIGKSTIVIPTYNQYRPYLKAALRSACTQTEPCDIVVIDDGSDPKQEDVVEAIRREFTDTYIYYKYQENGGVANALNAGIEEAQGEYIQWLPSDDLFHAEKTTKQIKALKESGLMASYTGWYDGIPGTGTYYEVPTYQDSNALLVRLNRHCFFSAASCMWHRDVFSEVGGFDPTFKHTQDYEFLLRVAMHLKYAPVNEMLYRRRPHRGQMSTKLADPEEAHIKNGELSRLRRMYSEVMDTSVSST